jgi:hypothetical protein
MAQSHAPIRAPEFPDGIHGKADGDFNVATFHHPQNMALCSPCWRALTERIVLWYSGGY